MSRIKKLVKSDRGIYEIAKTEEHVVREITDMLDLHRIPWWRVVERIPTRGLRGQVIGRFQTPGIPDLMGVALSGPGAAGSIRRAVPFWIEVKGPKGQLRPAQRHFLELYQSMGLCAFMARDWQDVKTNLGAMGVELKIG